MSRLIILIAITCFFSNANASTDISFQSSVLNPAHKKMCESEDVLSYINKNQQECILYLKDISSHCDMDTEVLYERVVKNDSDDVAILFSELKSLVSLYYRCMQSSIFESVENKRFNIK